MQYFVVNEIMDQYFITKYKTIVSDFSFLSLNVLEEYNIGIRSELK